VATPLTAHCRRRPEPTLKRYGGRGRRACCCCCCCCCCWCWRSGAPQRRDCTLAAGRGVSTTASSSSLSLDSANRSVPLAGDGHLEHRQSCPGDRASCPFSVPAPLRLHLHRDGQSAQWCWWQSGSDIVHAALSLLDQPSGGVAGAFAFDIHAPPGDAKCGHHCFIKRAVTHANVTRLSLLDSPPSTAACP
jgi:hypothetical protein